MKKIPLFLSIILLILLLGVSVAHAGGGYDLSWWTSDGGGGLSSGPVYTLNGTIGQPEGGRNLTNGAYTLYGGFWHPAGNHSVFIPVVAK